MNLESRKISFVQEFLRLQNEEIVSSLENFLQKQKSELIDADYKPALKAEGLMTRDPRMVERKKPGQKKARKKFQFSKR